MKKDNDLNKNFTKVPNSLARNPVITPHAKAIYLYLRSHSPSFAGYKKIQEATGIGSKTTVSKSLDQLIKHNLLKRTNRENRKSNLYDFPHQCMDNSAPFSGPELVQKVDPNKNKVIITTNNQVSSPAETVEDTLRTQEILSEIRQSLGGMPSNNKNENNKSSFILGT